MNHPEQGVYLVWKWDWIVSPQTCTESPTCEAPQSRTESPMGEYEHDLRCVGDSDEETDTFHTVRFKCIGATRDNRQQHALELANELLQAGKEVKVDLFPEPANPVDAKAVAFKCFLDDQRWHRIGYIVREALDDVHDALLSKSITNTKFGWVKFRIDLQRSGPEFYAAIDITRKGQWSSTVCNSASPR